MSGKASVAEAIDTCGFNPFLFRGVLSGSTVGLGRLDLRTRFNPFLFRGVLSATKVWLGTDTGNEFQSLLIQGCVVCRLCRRQWRGLLSFNPFLFRGVLSGYHDSQISRESRFQSLLIQGCVVCMSVPSSNGKTEYVSIPSYSGVCCLP